jgi:hypothetical protein
LEKDMRKLAIALATIIGMTSAAHADWNGHRHHQQHYHGGGGGDAGAAIFGGLVGGLIIGGMINQMNQPRYQYYYEPYCREVVVNRYWNGWQWVYRTATVCE